MTPAECNLWTNEQEPLATVDAVKCWTPYIGSLDIVWHIDPEALIWLAKQPELSKKQASWLRSLCEYPIELKYIPGPQNEAADALSRRQIMQRVVAKMPETTGGLCHRLDCLELGRIWGHRDFMALNTLHFDA